MADLDNNELFLSTLDELDVKAQSNDSYDLLTISALIRKLLIDSDPLVHRVNRQYKLKLQFHIGLPPDDLKPSQPGEIWSIQDGFDPTTGYPGRPAATVSLDGLLSAKVLMAQGRFFTVKDFVKYEANIKV